jgi:hypothetical protein
VALLLVEAKYPLDVPSDDRLAEWLGGTQAQHTREVALENDDVALDPHLLDQQVRAQGEDRLGAVGAVGQPGIGFGEEAGGAQQTQVALEQVRGQRIAHPDRHEVSVAVRSDPVRGGERDSDDAGRPVGESGRRGRKQRYEDCNEQARQHASTHGELKQPGSWQAAHFIAYRKTRSRL